MTLGRRADAIVERLAPEVGTRVSVERDGVHGRRWVAAGRNARVGRARRRSVAVRQPSLRRLRTGQPPVIARIEDDALLLDLRTIDPADDAALGTALIRAMAPRGTRMTVVIGTAGHIDHGKTALLRALTGIDADRLPEERRRGMTIDVGYAHLALPDGTELDFVDVPGHDRLVGNMLVGAGEIDAALFVVAADDGPRAQTLEHLELLDALAIRHGVVVVTKTDIAGPERSDEVVAAAVAPALRDVARRLAGAHRLVRGRHRHRRRPLGARRVARSGPEVGRRGDLRPGVAPGDRSGLRGQGSRRRRHRDPPRAGPEPRGLAASRPGRSHGPSPGGPGPRCEPSTWQTSAGRPSTSPASRRANYIGASS